MSRLNINLKNCNNIVSGENLTDENFEKSFKNGIDEIKIYIPDFDYEDVLKTIKNDGKLKKVYNQSESGYEKLQIFRIINEGLEDSNDVMRKFINEAYHIENEFIHQLNPRKYDLTPEFIIEECDKYLNTNGTNN